MRMMKEDVQAAMAAVVRAHKAIDEAGLYLRATRLEGKWNALWGAMDALQTELIKEKVEHGIDCAEPRRRQSFNS